MRSRVHVGKVLGRLALPTVGRLSLAAGMIDYCIVLYCIVLYCIVLYLISFFLLVSETILLCVQIPGTQDPSMSAATN